MSKRRMVSLASVGIGILSLLCLLGLFVSFHDIFHDYVSSNAIANQGLSLTLPNWTLCSMEWQIVSFSFWAMFLFNAALFIISIWQNRTMKMNGIK
jgi:hypothetical protein